MIRLTDEEIINMVTDFHFSGETNRHILSKQVAKAQLKKVVEWMKLYAYDTDGNVVIRGELFEALLEEVKG